MIPPLAERLRPQTLDQYIGQEHLVAPGAIIRRMIDSGNVSSFILWGPPGVGKTTLARIIANTTESPFYILSAVNSGVKEVREVIERCRADARSMFTKGRPILFIDEIHRFSKSQQDSLLGAVEDGTVTLIGATTENPSFEVIRPLLSVPEDLLRRHAQNVSLPVMENPCPADGKTTREDMRLLLEEIQKKNDLSIELAFRGLERLEIERRKGKEE